MDDSISPFDRPLTHKIIFSISFTFRSFLSKVDGIRPKVPTHIPLLMQKIMPLMWSKDVKKRPQFPEIESCLKISMTKINLDSGVDLNKKVV